MHNHKVLVPCASSRNGNCIYDDYMQVIISDHAVQCRAGSCGKVAARERTRQHCRAPDDILQRTKRHLGLHRLMMKTIQGPMTACKQRVCGPLQLVAVR